MKLSVLKKKAFIAHIEDRVIAGLTHMDAILDYCEKYNVDPSTVSSLIPKQMKEKIRVEAKSLNLLQNDPSPERLQ